MSQLLDHYGRPFGVKKTSNPRARSYHKNLKARYDAAQTTVENERHWANADGFSANAALNPSVRRTVRNRARYEANEANSYAKGIVLTFTNDVIGRGPRLQLSTGNKNHDSFIERLFHSWCSEIRLPEKLRTLRTGKTIDGEGLGHLFFNEKLDNDIKLDLWPFESEELSTPDLTQEDKNAIDGVRYDRYGNPSEYHKLKHHPGNNDGFGGFNKYDVLSPEFVVHLYRQDRPGQGRGVSELAPSLPLFAQLRRYTLAVLAAAETAADYNAVMYTDSNTLDPDVHADDAYDVIELERRMLTILPAQYKLAQIKAEQPTTTYPQFRDAILNEIARCLNMPFNIAAGNSSDYNYASGRMDHQTYYKNVRIEQHQIERVVLHVIFKAWARYARLYHLLPFNVSPYRQWVTGWYWDGTEHVDPQKAANATNTRLKNKTTTYKEEFAKENKDYEAEFEQMAKEKSLMQKLGITPDEVSKSLKKSSKKKKSKNKKEKAKVA